MEEKERERRQEGRWTQDKVEGMGGVRKTRRGQLMGRKGKWRQVATPHVSHVPVYDG